MALVTDVARASATDQASHEVDVLSLLVVHVVARSTFDAGAAGGASAGGRSADRAV